MRIVMRRCVLIALVLTLWPEELPVPVASTGGSPEFARGDQVIAASNQIRRRRRRRPRRIRSSYDVIPVDNGGSIEGVVVYRKPPPSPETIQIVKDHETCDARKKSRAKIIVDEEGNVANAVAFLGNIKSGKPIPTPTSKPTITQRRCTFEPHVQIVHTRQAFDVVNDDPVAHNAQGVQNMVTLFNPLQPKKGLRNEFSIRRPGLTSMTCAVHNWMKAYVYVLPHPYHAVTGSDGRFVIGDVPPGEYELVVWQEHVGERTQEVVVEPGKTTQVEFELNTQ